MMGRVLYSTVTRIADLPTWPFPYERLAREEWASGDYVLAEVRAHNGDVEGTELADGRICLPMAGDLIVGAFARRFATLELTGTFEDIGPDGAMCQMTEGGCFGAATSLSRFSPKPMPLSYLGHVLQEGRKVRMADFVPTPPEEPFDIPVVLLVGTSMSAGKTFSGRVAVRELKALGHTVVAAKLTGAGRWHDTLSFADSGADYTFDFMDAGLPTTIYPPSEYGAAVSGLLRRMGATGATVAVIEAGASPLEPYNGGTLVDLLGETVAFTILAASDPYAVVGIQAAWKRKLDLVTGPAANTKAGVALVHELTGLPALDVFDYGSHAAMRQWLESAVGAKGS